MDLLEIMERVGSRQTNKVKAYVEDALTEIAELIPERTTYLVYNIVAGQRFYDLPANYINLLGVYRHYATSNNRNQYVRIGSINNLDLHETGTTALSSTEIIII